jgi:hypothetical protein
VPVIWHDNTILFGDPSFPVECEIKDLTLAEFEALGKLAADGSASKLAVIRTFKHKVTRQRLGARSKWHCSSDDTFPTLEAVFAAVPAHVAFDIEVKMTTPDDLVSWRAGWLAGRQAGGLRCVAEAGCGCGWWWAWAGGRAGGGRAGPRLARGPARGRARLLSRPAALLHRRSTRPPRRWSAWWPASCRCAGCRARAPSVLGCSGPLGAPACRASPSPAPAHLPRPAVPAGGGAQQRRRRAHHRVQLL